MWDAIVKILSILGALGVFLYGMKVMSEGIQKVAGNSMRKALATMTKNRFSAVFTGFFTTCLVQSSSATTVLVVSFVNAGLLTLVESVGVIMGANLGTTITAWLVAFIPKFKIAAVALPMIGIGLPLLFVGKNRWKSMGETLIGFGLLFFGLSLLKEQVPNASDITGGAADTVLYWIDLIQGYGHLSIIFFLIAGIVLTVVVQSSSAAMAITITCATSGWLGSDPQQVFIYSAAIVLGENIGTTVTAWLASFSANVHAKRAARAHFLFNVIGTIWAVLLIGAITSLVWKILPLFPEWMVDMRTKKASADASESLLKVAFAVAIFHTTFNLLNIIMLLPFTKTIASIVEKWVKEKPEGGDRSQLKYISQQLVDLGELNIMEVDNALKKFSKHNIDMFAGYTTVLDNPDQDMSELVQKLRKMEDDADLMMHDITNYLVRCTANDMSDQNAEEITAMLLITSELEECSDAIYRLVKIAERKFQKGHVLSSEHSSDIKKFVSHIKSYLEFSHANIFKTPSEADISSLNDQAGKFRNDFNKKAMARMSDGDVKVEMLSINTHNELRGIADQLTHVMNASAKMNA